MLQSVEVDLNGKKITIETGVLAKQASGAVLVKCGDTVVMATVVASKQPKPGVDFLPLSVDYREKMYAAGRVPGGFFKREGRPTEKEILCSRLIDRPLRPLFPKGMANDIQVLCNTLSYDPECNPDTLAIVGASAALVVSDIPFAGPIGAVKVGRIDNKLVINPSVEEEATSDLSLVMAGTIESIMMVEAGALEVSEDTILEALEFGHEAIKKIVSAQNSLRELAGKEKFVVAVKEPEDNTLEGEIKNNFFDKIKVAALIKKKGERQEALSTLKVEVKEQFGNEAEDNLEDISKAFGALEKEAVRSSILNDGIRGDGRTTTDIRPISISTSVLPRTHGSAVFTRGETQALVVTTLGTKHDEQRIDSIEGSSFKDFLLHYNFPPFCVGEARFSPGPGRREIGHGALAERAVKAVMPEKEGFPYAVRIVSEIYESNGSSSMASICGASLSLMNAGVPIKGAVAGIAMGLVLEGDQLAILSDITGQEDHLGDMDFKVAGTVKGITALQMDIKIAGITKELMSKAMTQAKQGRDHILQEMSKALSTTGEMSTYAPRITKLTVPTNKVRDLIGPGGKMIKSIIEKTGVSMDIEDDGTVLIASSDAQASAEAIEMVNAVTQDPEIGRIYDGKVKKIMDFGAFVEIIPGVDGLVHISQLADYRVQNVTDIVKEGDEIKVKVLDIDSQGKIKLSKKEADKEADKDS